jgi:hypothetical protein
VCGRGWADGDAGAGTGSGGCHPSLDGVAGRLEVGGWGYREGKRRYERIVLAIDLMCVFDIV